MIRLGTHPEFVLSIGESDERLRSNMIGNYPFVELRTDLCHHTAQQLKSDLALAQRAIVAIREHSSESEILNLAITAVENRAEFIDLDTQSAKKLLAHCSDDVKNCNRLQKQAPRRTTSAEKHCTNIIISNHNYRTTPQLKRLMAIYNECYKMGEQVAVILTCKSECAVDKIFVKICTAAKTIEDGARVLSLYQERSIETRKHLIAFAMGKATQFTRITSALLGSPFIYCHAGNPTAAGQLSLKEAAEKMYPAKAHRIKNSTAASTATNCCSKSESQRALLLATYASGTSILENFTYDASSDLLPDDTFAALMFANESGAKVKLIKENGTISQSLQIVSNGSPTLEGIREINCGESGFLARSVIALCSILNKQITITGKGTLLKRDFSSSVDIIENNGGKCSYTPEDDNSVQRNRRVCHLPITVEKGITRSNIVIDGSSTSQDISGYLMALPLRKKGGKIITQNNVSLSYIALTIRMMRSFGVEVAEKGLIFKVAPNSKYSPCRIYLENGWSSGANILVHNVLCSLSNGGERIVALKDFALETHHADEKIIDILRACGVKTELLPTKGNRYDISVSCSKLNAYEADCSSSPDLIPLLTVLALFCQGESRIRGIGRLINKESNRAASLLTELQRIQTYLYELEPDTNIGRLCINVAEESFRIKGQFDITEKGKTKPIFKSATPSEPLALSAHNDHRIAMALIILLKHIGANIVPHAEFYIDNIECIGKSFPSFIKYIEGI